MENLCSLSASLIHDWSHHPFLYLHNARPETLRVPRFYFTTSVRLPPSPECVKFRRSNVPGGVHSPLLAHLCGGDSLRQCYDQDTLGVHHTAAWMQVSQSDLFSEETLVLVLDQASIMASSTTFPHAHNTVF